MRSEGVRTIYNGSQMPPLFPEPESGILEALTQEYWQPAVNYFKINYKLCFASQPRSATLSHSLSPDRTDGNKNPEEEVMFVTDCQGMSSSSEDWADLAISVQL